MNTHSPNKAQGQRRLDQAIEYVARAWFPANPEVLSRIQNRAQLGEYDNQFELLLIDLKSDFSIFTYVLKEIRDKYPEGSEMIDPISLMRTLDISKLIEMLTVSSDAISRHSFLEMERSQAARLKHFILGCSTSELLADKKGGAIDAGQVFTISVVRQLGLNLVAWNYPSIYGRVVQSIKDGAEGELETLLTEQLGFEPIQLATALTLPLHLREHFAAELGLNTGKDDSQTDERALISRKLCEIGEAFAILNDPETYPTGTAKSNTSIKEIEGILGPGGTEQINRVVKGRYVTYLTASPDLAKLGLIKEQPGKGNANNNYGKALSLRNPYLSRLPDKIREDILGVYAMVKKGQVCTEGIQTLATVTLPSVGFVRGAIFLIEQNDLTLTPRLRIGTDTIKRYKSFSCMDSGLSGNPVVDAFYCSYPIKQMSAVFLGEKVSLISGVLGVSERAGVLYLEMNNALSQNVNLDVLGIFKALRQCMNDCLNLR